MTSSDSSELKIPLGWRQRSTPKRGTRRSRNWVKLHIGHRFAATRWILVQGPWRQIKRTGSLSWVTVRCAAAFGGCDEEHDRTLNSIVRGNSAQCRNCYLTKGKFRTGAESDPDGVPKLASK